MGREVVLMDTQVTVHPGNSCGTLSSALKVTFICPSCAGGSGFVFDGINDNKWHTKQESKLIKEDVLE